MNSLNDLFENENLWKDKSVMKTLSAGIKNTGGDVNLIDKSGETPLHHLMIHASTTSDCLTVLNALLAHRADVNIRNNCEKTCLHLLFRNKNLWKDTNILDVLFSSGAHVNTVDWIGYTPLHHLMEYADTASDCLAILNALLTQKVDVNIRSRSKMTPLHLLFQNKNLWKNTDILDALFTAGAHVNIVDWDGNTPLHHLLDYADSDCLTILNALLAHKADFNVKNELEQTPIYSLFKNKNLWKDTNILDALLTAGAHVNTVDRGGNTPLHVLMEHANTASDCVTVLNALITHKANVNVINEFGTTLLHLLFQNKNLWNDTELLNALLSAGSHLNVADKYQYGRTPLHHLMEYADTASDCVTVLNALLTHKADVNIRDGLGNTPLHLLFQNKNLWKDTGILNALLSAGAHVNAVDGCGHTPLHHLMREADSDFLTVLTTLLVHNVDVNARCEVGMTPIYFLLRKPEIFKYINLILILIAEGADLNIVKSDGETPLSIILNLKRNANDSKPWKDILELIIKCEILKFQKYFCNVISENVLVSQFMTLDIFRKIYAQEEWSYLYVKYCISELLQMMKDTFEGNFSLSRHLFHFFENKRQLKSFPSDILDNVLDYIVRGCYPCYGEIIKLLIHPHDFADHLTLSVCSKNKTEELFLNSYCVSTIVKFLPKNDLINLHQAAYRANEKRILEDS